MEKHINRSLRFLLCWSILLMPPASVRAAEPEPGNVTWTKSEVEALLKRRVEQNATRGIAVALIAPDGKVEIVTAGDSGNPARPQVDGDTLYEIGSITKVFTATMLAQKVEEGSLRLESRVRDVLPARRWRSPGVGDVTLKQLTTHTSGLPRVPTEWKFMSGLFLSFRNPYVNYSADDLWAYVSDLEHTPRDDYEVEYSNLGAGLLGQVLAEQEGVSYEALVQRRILGPLGMGASGIRTEPARKTFLAVGHSASLVPQSYWDIPSMPGAGALRSSTNDMARFIAAQMQGTLPGAKATQAEYARLNERMTVGLGWFIRRAQEDEIFWHNGGTGGFRTFAGFSSKSGQGVVVLSNASVEVDDLGLHLLNRKFKPNADPRSVHWPSILIGAALAFGLLMRAWFAADPAPPVPATPEENARRKSGRRSLRDRFQDWRQRTRIGSRIGLIWAVLDLLAIAAFLYLLAPWEWVGVAVRNGFFALAGVLVLRLIWRLRALPWRDPQPATNRLSRLFAHVVTLALLGGIGWNLW